MGQFDRAYYGTTSDIDLAKKSGLQGKFYDVSTYGEVSKYNDILHAYKTGANPVLLGGAGATGGVNDQIYKQLINSGANVQRIGGKDRYEVQNNFRNYVTDLQKQKNQFNLENQRKTLIDENKNQVNQLYDRTKQAQLEQLKAQRDKAIGGINQQKAQVAPMYQAKRDETDVVNAQNVQRLRELMASSGLQSSGENISANVSLSNQRLNSLNTLNAQEQQTMNDYDRRIADLNNPAEENALIAQLEAERARALIDSQNRADEMAYQRSRDSVEDDRYMEQRNYQQGRDLVADQRYQNEFNYQKQRDAIGDQQNSVGLAFEKQKFASETAWRSYVYNNMSASEKAQLEMNKRQFGDEMAWRIEESNRADKLARDQMAYDAGFQAP